MNDALQTIRTTDLEGTWGYDIGYSDRSDEVRIRFDRDHTGAINPHADAITFSWDYEPSTGLKITIGEHTHGPFDIRIVERDLPMGTFTSLISSSALLPFGLREFQKIADTSDANPPDAEQDVAANP